MSNLVNGKTIDNFGHPEQLNLFRDVQLDPAAAIKLALREALKNCPLSREQVVDEMNRLADGAGFSVPPSKTTLAVLDKWAAAGANAHLIPLKLVPIFCRATGSTLPLAALSAFTPGARIISADDYALLEWAKLERTSRQVRKQARRLAADAGVE
jgi:hypothetical protein